MEEMFINIFCIIGILVIDGGFVAGVMHEWKNL